MQLWRELYYFWYLDVTRQAPTTIPGQSSQRARTSSDVPPSLSKSAAEKSAPECGSEAAEGREKEISRRVPVAGSRKRLTTDVGDDPELEKIMNETRIPDDMLEESL